MQTVYLLKTIYQDNDQLGPNYTPGTAIYMREEFPYWSNKMGLACWFATRREAVEIALRTEFNHYHSALVKSGENRWRIVELNYDSTETEPSAEETTSIFRQNGLDRLLPVERLALGL